MSEVLAALRWWLAVEVVGLAALPITLRLFRRLPDGGYGLAKAVGLLLVGYSLWLGASFRLLTNSRPAIIFLLLAMAGFSLYIWQRNREEMAKLLRQRWILGCEGLFSLSFLLYAVFRAYDPAILGTEKPMDLAFLNAILASRHFPPHDPWMSGYAISYYYFGYLLMALLTRLSGVPSSMGYNLALTTLFAQVVVGASCLAYNLVAVREESRAPLFGLMGGLMVAVAGNLEGALELMHAKGLGPASFWRWLDIRNLAEAPPSSTWYPLDHWWWWRASRVIKDIILGRPSEVIDEFPSFSFLLGDLHPHVMALPFGLLALGLGFNLLQEALEGPPRYTAPSCLFLPLALGGLGFLNSWDLPTFTALTLAAYGLGAYLRLGNLRGAWAREVGLFVLYLVSLSLFLYLPFWVGLQSQAGGPQLVPVRTRLHQYLVIHGLFIFVGLSLVALELREHGAWEAMPGWVGKDRKAGVLRALSLAAALLLGPWIFVRFLGLVALLLLWPVSGSYPLTATFLLVFIALGVAALAAGARTLRGREGIHRESSALFALMLLMAALSLTLLVEFFFIRDIFNSRMNSVFKFYYQAWTLFASSAAFGVYYVAGRGKGALGRRVWLTAFGLLSGASLLYPMMAIHSKTGGFAGPATLDGLAYYRTFQPGSSRAIAWLRAQAGGDEVILEAPGPEYSEYAPVSTQTGLAAVLGWGGHEYQWRGDYSEPRRRESDIEAIYKSPDQERVLALLDKYGVTYVWLGPLEREKYGLGQEAEAKFERLLRLVYREGGVSIYRRR